MMTLEGKVALVTGGGTGIGLMIAQGFAQNGAKVYIAGRRAEVLQKEADAYSGSGSLIPLLMDVIKPGDIASAVERISKEDGKLDVLVNNAGIALPSTDPNYLGTKLARIAEGKLTYDTESFEGFESILKVNTIAPYFVTVGFIDLLVKGAKSGNRAKGDETSSVINISSAAANLKIPIVHTSACYAMSKVALEFLSIQLSARFAKDKLPIRVNTISPAMFKSEIADEEFWESLQVRTIPVPGLSEPIPIGRFGLREEMAQTAVFLATNNFVNAAVIPVQGGFTLLNP